jgi:2-aminoadipate transaminase
MSGFAYENLFAKSVPAPAVRFAGYPKYNFIGGHNDPTLIPIEGLIEATASALRKEGPNLAMYTAAQGNQGHRGLREFVKSKAKLRGIDCSTDDILITAGSGQAIDLINAVLLEAGDTVILEEFSYGGAISKLKREGQKIVGAPLDEDGIKIDALANIL